jgi:hypothetical protein
LALTLDGLGERDRLVFNHCMKNSVPTVITLGGGYSSEVADTVEAHCNTIRAARAVFSV